MKKVLRIQFPSLNLKKWLEMPSIKDLPMQVSLEGKNEEKSSVKISCKTCKKEVDKYVYNKQQEKTIEVTIAYHVGKKLS